MEFLDNPKFDENTLFHLLESENYQELKEIQQANERRAVIDFFMDKLTKIFIKLRESEEIGEMPIQILNNFKTKVSDLITTTGNFSTGKTFSFGGSSVVLSGSYKFMDVAIKKISLGGMDFKQLVNLLAFDLKWNRAVISTKTS